MIVWEGTPIVTVWGVADSSVTAVPLVTAATVHRRASLE
jgi:hypothetical protein